MKKIAVILPCYKPCEYLRNNFDSIEKQSLSKSDYCVYIGLNGPIYKYEGMVLKLLAEYSFRYKYYYFETKGVSFARNTLIDKSSEDYLVFLDDDDEISSNYIENLLSVTTPTTMGLANIVNFTGEKNNQFQNYIGKTFIKLPKKGSSAYEYRKYFSSPCAKMLHRNMIKQIRFDTKLALGEDGFFMAKLSKNIESFEKCSDDTVYYVNVRADSSSRKNINKIKDFKRIMYLAKCYTIIFLTKGYDKLFITTRILATLRHLKRLF
jgi:glycosyltransferase involved in cell wall biosynthesis